MSVAEDLVRKGTDSGYFKFKKNADEFTRLWTQKSRVCGIERTNGNVIDLPGQPYHKRVYFCACFTKAERRYFDKMDKLLEMSEKQPRKYWQYQLRQGVMKHIDPEIRQLITELNAKGLYTVDSCAGHPGEHPHAVGMIFFKKRNPDCRKIREILMKYGLTGLKRGKQPSDRLTIYYEFDPIGKPRTGRARHR